MSKATHYPNVRILLLLLFTGLRTIAFAQEPEQYIFSHIGIMNGLISDEVTHVQQDPLGFVWIGTLNGIQRYDGKRFVYFRHTDNNPFSLPNDKILGMQLDNKNRLWVLCAENKIGYINVTDLKFHEAAIRLPDFVVKKTPGSLFIDKQGNVLFILTGNGLFTYSERKNEFSEQSNLVQLPPRWKPLCITQDKISNNYWIGCDSGLAKYSSEKHALSYELNNPDKDAVINGLKDLNNITRILIDKKQRCWLLAEKKQLFSFDGTSHAVRSWNKSIADIVNNVVYEIQTLNELSDGSIWIGGANVFAKFDTATKKFENIPSDLPGEYSIRYDVVRNISEDKENNVWTCTNKGLYRFNTMAQLFHAISNRKPGNGKKYTAGVSSITQLRDGSIVAATFGDGAFSYDSNFKPKHSSLLPSPRVSQAWCIFQQSGGDVWESNHDGSLLIRHAVNGKEEMVPASTFDGSAVRQMVEDKNGNVWLGTQNGALVQWNKSSKKFILKHRLNSMIQRLFADSTGTVWAGTATSGVYKINSAGDIEDNYTSSGQVNKTLTSSNITDILQYNDSLYIFAGDGLNIFNIKANSVQHYNIENDLPSKSIINIVKDKAGYLWLTTQSMLCSINFQKQVVTTYSPSDGVYTSAFNMGSACLLRDGRIAIGTAHDMMVFDPGAIAKNGYAAAPDISITGFSVMNKPMDLDSLFKRPVIELNSDENSVTIEFSTLTYLNIYGVFYKLEGLDKNWQLTGRTHQAVYSYLPPGNYTFKAYCVNGDGIPSKHTTELSIKIKAPFWKTWWFLSFMAFVIVTILYWLDKLRMQKLRATESIRSRIATSLTDDLSSSLSSINIISELAKNKVSTDIDRTKEYIAQISDTSNRMIDSMYDVVWSVDPNNDSMEQTINRMKNFTAEMESLYPVDIVFEIDKAIYKLQPDMENRYELLSIFKEAVWNACKHSRAKHIFVNISYKKQVLVITVQDDGIGFETEAVKLGRGINEMRRRSNTIDASFTMQSEINTGTVIKVQKRF
ncbi:sensor histidine kinase [Pinibacter aurantiacus]|nr:sensor histidine kinase [Pinibacter aurantiacus]